MKKSLIIIALILFGFSYVSHKAQAAILYSQTANQDTYEGQTFVVDWFLDTEGKPINTFDLKLNFSKDVLQAIEANTGNSLINLWIKNPTIDNTAGTIELTGGITNGINNGHIPVFHSVFKATKTGTASITMDPGSMVLLNDGLGTSDTLKFKDELFNVYPASFIPVTIFSTTHPEPNIWYSNRNVEIGFTPKENTDYSFSFSSNIDIIPDDQVHQVPAVISYPDRPDGIYYFKLNSKVGPSTWQEAGVFRVQIDGTAPEAFTPLIATDPGVFAGNPFLSFSTLDKMSGMSHYKVKDGLFGKPVETQSPYKLAKPFVGDKVTVTAYDAAGNSTTETIVWKGVLSVADFKGILILIGVLAIAVHLIVRRKIARANKK